MKKIICIISIYCCCIYNAKAQNWQLNGNAGTTINNFIGSTDNKSVRFRSNNSQRMIIDSLGKVGIGISQPTTQLDLQNSGACMMRINSTGNSATVRVQRPTNVYSSQIQFRTGNGSVSNWYAGSAAGTDNFNIGTTSSASNLVVTTGGRVGIGTNAPGAKLEVAGQVKITGGTPGLGKVLTSDATGLATWQIINAMGAASTTLNNLTSPTSVNQSFIPSGNNSKNLGSSTKGWKDIYVTSAIYLDGAKFIYNSGNTNKANTAIGYYALLANSTGINNSATGAYSLEANTTGADNTAIGTYALSLNTTGSQNTATGSGALSGGSGSSNTANGYFSLNANTSGNNNTGAGASALFSNTTGSNNTATGKEALFKNTQGIGNTANGYQALFQNLTGDHNTATGFGALKKNKVSYNTAHGYSALNLNTTGGNNTGIGAGALQSNSSGADNTATGYFSLNSNTTGNGNIAYGYAALLSNTQGNNNTAIGTNALQSNTTGFSNVAIGAGALKSNTTGSNIIAIGDSALYNSVGGFDGNVAIGSKALYSNTVGYNLIAIGDYALFNNTGGSSSIAIGLYALTNNNGFNNIAVGNYALYNHTGTGYNLAVGHQSLLNDIDGIGNTGFGAESDVSSGSLLSATVIGRNAIVNASNKMQLGSSTTTISTSGGYTIVSDGRFKNEVREEDVPGLEFIKQLHPVAYNFNYKGFDDFLRKDMKNKHEVEDERYREELIEKGKLRQVGFIAQEVDNTVREKGYTFNGVYPPGNAGDNYALDYSRFVVPLVKGMQELDEVLKAELGNLKTDLSRVYRENEKLKSDLSNIYREIEMIKSVLSLEQKQKLNEIKTETSGTIEQNVPNPFSQTTLIKFYIPSSAKSAMIIVNDMHGRMMTQFSNLIPGSGTVTVEGGILPAGTYNYTLVIDGNKVDTKEMILTK